MTNADLTLAQFIGDNEFALNPRFRRGVESPWLSHCDFEVSSGKLWMGDPCGLHDEDVGMEQEFMPADYEFPAGKQR